MTDANMSDFTARLGRIQAIRRAGGGFEAPGTLGMSYYRARRSSPTRFAWARSALLVCISLTAIKAAVLADVGPEVYGDRLAVMATGDTVERLGAALLSADVGTVWLADRIERLRP